MQYSDEKTGRNDFSAKKMIARLAINNDIKIYI